MHVIFWEFVVHEEHVREFTLAYGLEGDWPQLFRCAEGYKGTRLLRFAKEPLAF